MEKKYLVKLMKIPLLFQYIQKLKNLLKLNLNLSRNL